MKKTNIFLKIAGIAMVLVGIVHGIDGIKLFQTGNTFLSDKTAIADSNGLRIASIGLIIVAVLFIISGIGVMMGKKALFNLSVVTLILYVIVGIINGQILYGEPLDTGLTVNMTIAILILALLYLGRSRFVADQIEN